MVQLQTVHVKWRGHMVSTIALETEIVDEKPGNCHKVTIPVRVFRMQQLATVGPLPNPVGRMLAFPHPANV